MVHHPSPSPVHAPPARPQPAAGDRQSLLNARIFRRLMPLLVLSYVISFIAVSYTHLTLPTILLV